MPVLTVLDEFPSYEQPSATCLQATRQSAMYFICLPHCGLCSSGDAKSHNSTTSAQNYTKSAKCFQELMGTSTPLKACEHSGSFNLRVTCTEKMRNSFRPYSWHVRLRHQPSSHQPPNQLLEGHWFTSAGAAVLQSHPHPQTGKKDVPTYESP